MDEKISVGQQVETLTLDQALALAIQEAERGNGYVSPNPKVGCVILNEKSQLLASGFHHYFGGDHAEVDAVKKLEPSKLKNATVIVTLEPCSHEGKTPSCAKMLARYPIKKVIFGLKDPNPLVSGQGLEILKSAGIQVEQYSGKHIDDLEDLTEHFLKTHRSNELWVSLKVGTSLDGSLALNSGESKWITGPESREFAHFLRATHDGILIGANTLIADDPSLDVRHPKFSKKENKVFILDPFARTLERLNKSQILQRHKASDVTVIVGVEAKVKNLPPSVQVISCPYLEGQNKTLDLKFLKSKLFELGLKSILVEGGAATLSAFIAQNQAHRLYQFLAPSLLGGGGSICWTKGLEVLKIENQIRLKRVKYQTFGQDLMVTGLFNVVP